MQTDRKGFILFLYIEFHKIILINRIEETLSTKITILNVLSKVVVSDEFHDSPSNIFKCQLLHEIMIKVLR